jgi:hypothetical protein
VRLGSTALVRLIRANTLRHDFSSRHNSQGPDNGHIRDGGLSVRSCRATRRTHHSCLLLRRTSNGSEGFRRVSMQERLC